MGERLGVSRSALYRHFADKQALLAAVGSEGFRKLGQVVAHAWERNGRGRIDFEAMARAYVQFAGRASVPLPGDVRRIHRVGPDRRSIRC
ncbi:MAG: helix-turn-helix transcriptional regulator [Acidobacteriota bacterium]|nr:helix-turn-helix transcriptional regulator [Acidobacteriota bacterium]